MGKKLPHLTILYSFDAIAIENNKRFVRQLFPLFNTYSCMCVCACVCVCANVSSESKWCGRALSSYGYYTMHTHTHTYSVHKYTQTHFKHHRSGTAIFVMICVNRSALVFWLVTSFLLLFGVAIRFYGFFLLLHNIFPPCVQQHKNTHAHTALFIVNHPFCTSGSIQFKLNFTLPCIYTRTVCIRAN